MDEAYWLSVLSGERRGLRRSLLRGGLSGLEALYGAGLAVYLGAEKIGLRRRGRLSVPVVSVGNLTVGGTGKTPFTQWLVRSLIDAGQHPGVLNRGHGGALAPNPAMVSVGDGRVALSAAQAGDEAVLLASTLPAVAVAVGKDRRTSGRMLIDAAHPSVIVLDDGLQYWQLARNLDIVLLDSRRPFDNGHALPRGLMREPRSGLRRAGAIVFTRSDAVGDEERDRLRAEAERTAPGVPQFFAAHRPAGLSPLDGSAAAFHSKRPLLVCGIARPDSFERAVRGAGHSPAGLAAFSDHQAYGSEQKTAIAGKIREASADCVITTAKDAVKLSADYFGVPVFVLNIEMTIEDSDRLLALVAERCGFAATSRPASGDAR